MSSVEALGVHSVFFSILRRLPRTTLFPYTTLFRSTLGSASSIVASSGNIIVSNAGTITGSGFGLTLDRTSTRLNSSHRCGSYAGSATKSGTGTWTLSGDNTYTGATTVNAGTLKEGV